MNLILDMNIPKGWVEFFKTHGHKAEHWRDIGNICAANQYKRNKGDFSQLIEQAL